MPTAGVDLKARRESFGTISQPYLARGGNNFSLNHYMDEAEKCNKLSYIAYGKLLPSGTQKEIIDSCGIKTYNISGKNFIALFRATGQYKS